MVKFIKSCFLFLLLCSISTPIVAIENKSNVKTHTTTSVKVANKAQVKPFYNLSQLENHVAGVDSYEPFNRSMFAFNKFLMDYIVKPVGVGYTTIFPRPVITCLDNAFSNLEWPFRALSCLASGEYTGAKDETLRFFINTTLGLGGLFDVSRLWFNIYPTERDFGLAFASWGMSQGESLVLPFMAKNNVRDLTGSLFDSIFDAKTYIPFSGAPVALNTAVYNHRLFQNTVKGSLDPYSAYRAAMTLNRQIQYQMLKYKKFNYFSKKVSLPRIPYGNPYIKKGFFPDGTTYLSNGVRYVKLNNYYSLGPYQDTLRVTFLYPKDNFNLWYMRLSAFNNDFSKRCQARTIQLDPNRKELEYGYWEEPVKQVGPVNERLLIILPGIGGLYNSTTPESLASVFNQQGYKVVSIDSIFTWQFYASRTKGNLPGNIYDDCQEIRRAIYKIISSLKKDNKIKDPQITLMGYSLGALHTLKVAQLETISGNPFNFHRYLAINPPVSKDYAIERAQELTLQGANWTIEQTIENLAHIASNMMLLPYVKPFDALELVNLTKDQARFISGLYFRASLRELLYAIYKDGYLPFINVESTPNRRNKLYSKLDKVTFKEYAIKALTPTTGLSFEQLLWLSNLRSMSKELKNNQKIRVVHNVDDFLLSPSDHKFLNETLQDRLIWFSNGGHLGNLYLSEVQNILLELAR